MACSDAVTCACEPHQAVCLELEADTRLRWPCPHCEGEGQQLQHGAGQWDPAGAKVGGRPRIWQTPILCTVASRLSCSARSTEVSSGFRIERLTAHPPWSFCAAQPLEGGQPGMAHLAPAAALARAPDAACLNFSCQHSLQSQVRFKTGIHNRQKNLGLDHGCACSTRRCHRCLHGIPRTAKHGHQARQ